MVGEPGFEPGKFTGFKPAAYAVLLPPLTTKTLVRVPGFEPGILIGFEPTAYTLSAIPAWCRWWESNPQIARDLNPQHMPILLHRHIFKWRPVRDLNP